jgi:hypothetical protein
MGSTPQPKHSVFGHWLEETTFCPELTLATRFCKCVSVYSCADSILQHSAHPNAAQLHNSSHAYSLLSVAGVRD